MSGHRIQARPSNHVAKILLILLVWLTTMTAGKTMPCHILFYPKSWRYCTKFSVGPDGHILVTYNTRLSAGKHSQETPTKVYERKIQKALEAENGSPGIVV